MKRKKLLKVVLTLIFIMIIAIFVLNIFVINEKPIFDKIGKYSPMSVSLNDSIYIKAYSTSKYFNLIQNHEYEKAYKMLTDEYRRYKPFSEYYNEIQSFDSENYGVKSIKQLGEYAYAIELENMETGEIRLYTVYSSELNSKVFTISPDKFIYYDEPNITKKSKVITATLKEYKVMQDSIELSLTIKNNTSENQIIEDVKVNLSNGGVLANKFEKMTLSAKEEKSFKVVLSETNYYIPKGIAIETEKSTLTIDL